MPQGDIGAAIVPAKSNVYLPLSEGIASFLFMDLFYCCAVRTIAEILCPAPLPKLLAEQRKAQVLRDKD